jgi:hypothetical protein
VPLDLLFSPTNDFFTLHPFDPIVTIFSPPDFALDGRILASSSRAALVWQETLLLSFLTPLSFPNALQVVEKFKFDTSIANQSYVFPDSSKPHVLCFLGTTRTRKRDHFSFQHDLTRNKVSSYYLTTKLCF